MIVIAYIDFISFEENGFDVKKKYFEIPREESAWFSQPVISYALPSPPIKKLNGISYLCFSSVYKAYKNLIFRTQSSSVMHSALFVCAITMLFIGCINFGNKLR